MKAILIGAAILFFLFIFFVSNYGETRITDGAINNIVIGDSKQQVYQKLPLFLSMYKGRGDKIFVRIKASESNMTELATKPGYSIFVEPQFHDVGEEEFIQKDRWIFYINANSLDLIELKFESGKLKEVYRSKRLLELP